MQIRILRSLPWARRAAALLSLFTFATAAAASENAFEARFSDYVYFDGASSRSAPCDGCAVRVTPERMRTVGGVRCFEGGSVEIIGPDGAVRFSAAIDQMQLIEIDQGGATLALAALVGRDAGEAALMELEIENGQAVALHLEGAPERMAAIGAAGRVAALY